MGSKRPHPQKVFHTARKYGLFAMSSGHERDFKYEFWNKATGKWVMSYYPDRGFWTATNNRKGNAQDYRDALIAALVIPEVS